MLVSLISLFITVYHTFVRFIGHFIKFVKVFCWRFLNFGATLVNKIWRTYYYCYYSQKKNQSNNNKSKPFINAYSQSLLIKTEFRKLRLLTCMKYNSHFVVKFLSVNIFWNRPSILSFRSFREIFCEHGKINEQTSLDFTGKTSSTIDLHFCS